MPIKKNKISYKIDLEAELEELPPGIRKGVAKEVGDFVLEEIARFTASEISPVTGEPFKELDPKYAARKKAEGAGSAADLTLTGSMLGSIRVKPTKKDVELIITDNLQKKKAFNHNTGDTLPKRSFLPNDSLKSGKNSNLNKEIRDGIKRILDGHKDKV